LIKKYKIPQFTLFNLLFTFNSAKFITSNWHLNKWYYLGNLWDASTFLFFAEERKNNDIKKKYCFKEYSMGKRKKRGKHMLKNTLKINIKGEKMMYLWLLILLKGICERKRERESFNRKRRKKPNMEIESLKPVNNLKG
jgi:hypothetical protein